MWCCDARPGGTASTSARRATARTRRLAAVALTAATLGSLAAVSATAASRPHRPDVQVSRVQYDSPGRDDRSNRSLNGERVQITNNTRRATNLDGMDAVRPAPPHVPLPLLPPGRPRHGPRPYRYRSRRAH